MGVVTIPAAPNPKSRSPLLVNLVRQSADPPSGSQCPAITKLPSACSREDDAQSLSSDLRTTVTPSVPNVGSSWPGSAAEWLLRPNTVHSKAARRGNTLCKTTKRVLRIFLITRCLRTVRAEQVYECTLLRSTASREICRKLQIYLGLSDSIAECRLFTNRLRKDCCAALGSHLFGKVVPVSRIWRHSCDAGIQQGGTGSDV